MRNSRVSDSEEANRQAGTYHPCNGFTMGYAGGLKSFKQNQLQFAGFLLIQESGHESKTHVLEACPGRHLIESAGAAADVPPEARRHYHEFVTQANIISNGAVAAISTDPNLVNPWGIAYGPNSPFWIAYNGKSVATVYDADGTIHRRVVAIPAGASAQSNPTGIVFNGKSSGFFIGSGDNSLPARFIFVSETGTISGWNLSVDPENALMTVDHSNAGAVYKGCLLSRMLGRRDSFEIASSPTSMTPPSRSMTIPGRKFSDLPGEFHDPQFNPRRLRSLQYSE